MLLAIDLAKMLGYLELLFDLRLRDPLNQGQLLDQRAQAMELKGKLGLVKQLNHWIISPITSRSQGARSSTRLECS
jgi:hypothetical protein|uniref:Uncharacterized protein n=1 Tax=Picea glauca TaxID=3330 RepID=A0A101LWV2_PICGL|nr:hypothetical protein ABT39_MTgene6265 [Picea glauca]QHR92467.1 hypothetical protein Q903MT_gene6513 [Picea sitchensis]